MSLIREGQIELLMDLGGSGVTKAPVFYTIEKDKDKKLVLRFWKIPNEYPAADAYCAEFKQVKNDDGVVLSASLLIRDVKFEKTVEGVPIITPRGPCLGWQWCYSTGGRMWLDEKYVGEENWRKFLEAERS